MPKGIFRNPKERASKISQSLKKGSYFNCLICEKKFWRKQYDIKKGNNKFCSKDCYYQYQIGISKNVKNPYDKSGKNNPNWRGGITPKNKKIRNSEDYKIWRNSVFERDNWTCQKCGARSKKENYIRIEAHHIKPFANFPELRFEITNGLTLCKKCHSLEPKGKEIWNIQ